MKEAFQHKIKPVASSHTHYSGGTLDATHVVVSWCWTPTDVRQSFTCLIKSCYPSVHILPPSYRSPLSVSPYQHAHAVQPKGAQITRGANNLGNTAQLPLPHSGLLRLTPAPLSSSPSEHSSQSAPPARHARRRTARTITVSKDWQVYNLHCVGCHYRSSELGESDGGRAGGTRCHW